MHRVEELGRDLVVVLARHGGGARNRDGRGLQQGLERVLQCDPQVLSGRAKPEQALVGLERDLIRIKRSGWK